MDVIRILQLTDLHVMQEPHAQLKGIPTRELLDDVIRHAQASGLEFHHVITTGDHTHDEQPESYRAVRALLSPWLDRLCVVPGNHDDRGLLRAAFAERVTGHGDQPVTFSFRAGNWLCLGLDTHVPGAVHGLIDESQLSTLEAAITGTDATRVALFFHHPPVDVGSIWMDAIGLHGRELLQDVVRRINRIRLICCGHVHHEFATTLGAATVVTTPATGIQFSPHGATPTMAAEAPGYRVIELHGDDVRTRVVRLPEVRFVPAG